MKEMRAIVISQYGDPEVLRARWLPNRARASEPRFRNHLAERERLQRRPTVVAIPSDHLPLASHADAVADLVIAAARSFATGS